MLYYLTFLLVFISSTSVALPETASLNFFSLPSAQGWTYMASGNSVPETNAFLVNNDTLYQDTLEVGYAASGSNCYMLYDVINYSLPFTISIVAKVTQDGEVNDNPFGFGFGAVFSISESIKKGISIGIGKSIIMDSNRNTLSTSIDNTKFHNYQLEFNPQIGYYLYVDEELIFTGHFYDYSSYVGFNSYLIFGDFTGSSNAKAEIKKYFFTQTDERKGLIDLYNNTDGSNWTNNLNWLGEPGTECSWFGVICDSYNHIEGLHLFSNNLTGALPSSINNLSYLKSLILHNNNLTGKIPREILNIGTLESITLNDNNLSNNIISLMYQNDDQKESDKIGIEDAIHALKVVSGVK